MKIISLNINGTNIQAPGQIQNLTNNVTPFGQNLITLAVNLMLLVIILLSFAYLVFGGIKLITSRGEKQQFENARVQITYALIGLIIALLSISIISLIQGAFGIHLMGF